MSDNPTVSVVIPAYNAARWIVETLESVLAQTFRDFEVIVVNDGSTDNTAQVVEGYGERIRCIHKQNGGAASARNVGIRSAQGKYIAFVDADDLWAKEKLRLQVDLLKRTGLAWVYSDAFAFDGENGKSLVRLGKSVRQYDGDILESLFLTDYIPSPTPIIRRSVFEHVGYFDEDRTVRIGEDWDMWLRIAACYPIGLVSEPLAYYRVHFTSMTGSEDTQVLLQGHIAVLEKAMAREQARLGSLKNRAFANCYIGGGQLFARRGNITTARQMFENAIRLSPSLVQAYVYWAACLFGDKPAQVLMNLRHRLLYERWKTMHKDYGMRKDSRSVERLSITNMDLPLKKNGDTRQKHD